LTTVSSGSSGTRRLFGSIAGITRSRQGIARAARLSFSGAMAAVVVALVVFHASLLWTQIGNGRLLDPAVATRWALSAVLLGVLVALWRTGVPLFWGRRAVVVWVLAGLLHWNVSPAPDLDPAGSSPPAAQVLLDLPAAAATVLLTVTFFLLVLSRRRLVAHAAQARCVTTVEPPVARAAILSRHLASRAPPVSFA
jgi:hypothetical protein